jgi:uncharacterized protein
LDESLAEAYARRTAAADGAAVRLDQRQWLRQRDGCGSLGCLRDAYRARIASLNAGNPSRPTPMQASCRQSMGQPAAQTLVRRCIQVSPATHPPCHVNNPCDLILDEIVRGCSMYPAPRPGFCAQYPLPQ